MSTAKISSYSYKEIGGAPRALRGSALNALREPEHLAGILATIAKLFARKPGYLVSDPRLSPCDKATWDAIAILDYAYGGCREPVDVIAALAVISRRQAIKSIAALVACGYVTRERSFLQSMPDTLRPINTIPEPRAAANGVAKCGRCGAYRPVNIATICVVCRKQEIADQEVDKFLKEKGEAPLEYVYLGLKANGSKSSQRAIHRAFLRATCPKSDGSVHA